MTLIRATSGGQGADIRQASCCRRAVLRMTALTSLLLPTVFGCETGEQSGSASPYAAPPNADYAAEDVTLPSNDGRTLAGSLTLPARAGPAPAVVMITGSGLQDRDEHIPSVGRSYRPFRQIADTLTRIGIITLRLDDPGVGGSDPFPPDATPFTYGDDIRTALDFLRSRPEVDPHRLAVLGHSEGSVVAPYVAQSDSLVAAMVLLAPPAYTLARVNRFQRATRLRRLSDMSPHEIEAEVERTERSAELTALRDPWRGAVWDYDPLPTARSVRIPVLLLHGEDDQQVTADQSDTLAAAFREGGNEQVTLHMLPGTDHMFLRTAPSDEARANRSDQIARDVLGLIADWLEETLSPGRVF